MAKLDIPYPGGALVRVSTGGPGGDQRVIGEEFIRIRDRLIVGLGDSFASGEGNPDRPVEFEDNREGFDYGNADSGEHLDGYPVRVGGWDKKGYALGLVGGTDVTRILKQDPTKNGSFWKARARWWDTQCHRSLYSHQVRAALQIALESGGKEAVTFASFSCSGAKVETIPPAKKTFLQKVGFKPRSAGGVLDEMDGLECRIVGKKRVVVEPQIDALARELRFAACMKDKKGNRTDAKLCDAYAAGKEENDQYGPSRSIDAIFLSIGGNDIGFAKLVASAYLIPESDMWKMAARAGSLPCEKLNDQSKCFSTEELIDALPDKYARLNQALKSKVLSWQKDPESTDVYLTSYPQMGYASPLSFCDDQFGLDLHPDYKFNGEAIKQIETRIIPIFNKVMRDSANDLGWHFVDRYREEEQCGENCFVDHGICATSPTDDTNGDLPRKKGDTEAWTPFPPSELKPYASTQRRFRTPNDIFMAVNYHTRSLPGAGCNRLLSGFGTLLLGGQTFPTEFQLFLASFHGGAFHPNAEGHAVIGDALAAKFADVSK